MKKELKDVVVTLVLLFSIVFIIGTVVIICSEPNKIHSSYIKF